jgi:hypothetical protein
MHVPCMPASHPEKEPCMHHGAARTPASGPTMTPQIRSILPILLALTAAVTTAGADGRTLVDWDGAPPAEASAWTTLQGLDGGAIGVVPDGDALLADPRARRVGPYDASLPYLLISRGAYATLQDGTLPPAWQGALSLAGQPFPSSNALRAIPALAADRAQVLVLLPEFLRAIADEPGCRAQRLRTPAGVRGAGGAGATTPDPARVPPPEFWTAMVGAVSPDRLWADLAYLATTLQTRYSYTTQMTQACAYALDEFSALGLEASLDPFTYGGHALTNVVAIKPGTVDPARIYIVCGHLDSTSPSPNTTAPGAEDNGSGAAAVIEAARLFAPLHTDYTIYFVCFSAEEQGLIGSEHFASAADQLNLDIRGVLNFDMIAYYDPADADLWIEGFHYGTSSAWLMDLLAQNTTAFTDLEVYQYPGEGWGSDHEPFHSHGFPAVLSIENEWDSYPCYHRTCDTVDRLTMDLWRKILAANAITVGQLAGVQETIGGIRATVTLSDGGNPGGSRLRLQGTGYPERICGLTGQIDWPAMLPGEYTLITELTSYVPDTTQVTVASDSVTPVAIQLHRVGGSSVATGSGETARGVALRLSPAPAAPGTIVRLMLDRARTGALAVYDPAGRRLAELQPWCRLAAGEHVYPWDGRDAHGRRQPAGVYWVRWADESGVCRRSFVVTR